MSEELRNLNIDPIDLSNYILSRYPKTPLVKLIKMVYFLYGFYLTNFGKKIFSERFEAWKYGPVLNSIYYHFQTRYSDVYGIPTRDSDFNMEHFLSTIEGIDNILPAFLDQVTPAIENFSSEELVKITHMEGSAWKKASHRFRSPTNTEIDEKFLKDEEILEDFRSLIRNAEATSGREETVS